MCLFVDVESPFSLHGALEKCVLSVVNHRGREALRYTPPGGAMLRSESRAPRPDCNSTYFHSGPDAVYLENIPLFTARHHSRFKVPSPSS